MNSIEKLINQYNEKIADCQTKIDDYTAIVRQYRKDGSFSFYDSIDEVRLLRKNEQALRQAYVQFISEIKDLTL